MPQFSSRQWLYRNPLAVSMVLMTAVAVSVLFFFLDSWASTVLVAGTIVVVLALLLINLDVEVSREGEVSARFWGIPAKRIGIAEVAAVEVRDYSPMRDFGGWGWRFGKGGKRAFTLYGSTAVVITTHDGEEIFLGVDHPGQMERVLTTLVK
ncbi:hypothetical protein [Demequina sediminicola]|uniref:hypothetical protein n=1 Tax=Demequina sediminicola TaxID=1095026 RepID=UPI0007850269|nr:hypothetical protein [Demequina sediminicola]